MSRNEIVSNDKAMLEIITRIRRSGEERRKILNVTVFVEHENKNMWTDEDLNSGDENRIYPKDRRGCDHAKVNNGTCEDCGFDYDEYV